jgi:hypothetical protein
MNNVSYLIGVMVKYSVLFEVRTGFLNIIYTSFGFKGLIAPGGHEVKLVGTTAEEKSSAVYFPCQQLIWK